MKRRKLVALMIAAAVVCVSVFSVLLYSGFFDSSHDRGPIRIASEEEFTKENGVTGGSGAEEDPYIIEGWRIDSSGIEYGSESAGILIKGTSSHFIVRNVSVEGPNVAGILLKNAANGRIENSTIVSHYEGIGVHDSVRCRIIGNWVVSCFTGMSISRVDSVFIEENRFDDENAEGTISMAMRIGIRIGGSDFANVTISGNEFAGNGLEFADYEIPVNGNSSGLTITLDNTVNGRPIYFFESHSQFTLCNEQVGQLILLNCDNASISGLVISNASTCICLMNVSDCEIAECALSNAVFMGGIIARESTCVTIESSMIENARVYVLTCTNVTIRKNEITSVENDAVHVRESANVTITENSIYECASGLAADGEDIRIEGNTLWENGRGILASGGNITVTGNTFRDNGCGIMASMWSATDRLEVFLNDFINNTDSADCDAYLNAISFSNEALGRGNYWSEYDGLDEDDNGIGDTPFVVESSVQDYYPMMDPVNS